MTKTTGTAAASSAGPDGATDQGAQQEMRAGEQHEREEEKKYCIGQDLRAENDESRGECGENAGDQSDARRDQRAE